MNSDTSTAQSIINAAMQALKNGDRRAARHYAEQAAAMAPQIEQPWLLLAYLASPKAALFYLDRALEANPTSQRALAGKAWLNKQLLQDAPLSGAALPGMLPPIEVTQPTPTAPAARAVKTVPAYRRPMVRFSAWALGLVVLVALLGGIAALTSASRQADSQDAALARIVKTVLNSAPTLESSPTPSLTWTAVPTETATTAPTLTATATATLTRTASPTPTNTSTSTPTNTNTSTPTAKPTATPQPSPTQVKNTPVVNTSYSVMPGDTLNLIALRYNISLQNLIRANDLANPSLIRAGQVLTIPSAGLPPPVMHPTQVTVPVGPSGSGKEIQIDISEQHIYAYQNNELVFSFVASTGIGNSTRIGKFKVLDKIPKAYSNAFNIWMPYWMGIYYSGTLENGIHGLPLLTNGVELWGNLLGKPATYGCIESRTPDIKKLYNWAEIGTPVIIRQ